MISDHSSIAFEYMLLDRPIVVMDCPELLVHAAINPDKVHRLRSAADVVCDPRELIPTLLRSLSTPQRLSVQRRRTAADLFHEPGTATQRALGLVYRMIELPTPATDLMVDRNCALATAG